MGLFDRLTSDKCPKLDTNGPPIQPLFGSTTFYTFTRYFTGIIAIICTVVTVLLIVSHAFQYSIPQEQKRLMRVTTVLAFFTIMSWVTTGLSNHDTQFILPLMDLWEAWIFASFFLLVLAWLRRGSQILASSAPAGGEDGLPAYDKPAQAAWNYTPNGDGQAPQPPQSYPVPGRAYIFILQFPVMALIITIITVATNAANVYCVYSSSVHFAHLWTRIFMSISTVLAFVSLLRVVHMFKRTLKQFNVWGKLLSFKLIIFLRLVQGLIFSFLLSRGKVSPTSTLTYQDIAVGVPAIVLCCEMLLFSVVFLVVYRANPYNKKRLQGVDAYQGGVLGWRALFDMANVTDIVIAMFRAPSRLHEPVDFGY